VHKTLSEIIKNRKSIRSFTDKPVSNDIIREMLQKSSRAPSGGNLQPWKIYIVNEKSMKDFLEFQKNWKGKEEPPYPIYPEKLKEPYKTSRNQMGEQMYSLLDIKREDKIGRMNQMLKNFDFFDAPVGMFCFIDKQMGLPQWSDLGMFLQTFMLLAVDNNLDTCAQESWSLKQNCVKTYLGISDDSILFCGMAIGHANMDDKVNELNTPRRPIDEWATFIE
jgi:nitroreductase|tara:strand:+ start:880 stop:1542 length:663 start_codon:yes stop_codon:yes gene_type:complete